MASANRMTGSGRGVVIPHWVRISLTRKQFAQACLMKSCSNGLPFRRSLFPSKVTSPVWLFFSTVQVLHCEEKRGSDNHSPNYAKGGNGLNAVPPDQCSRRYDDQEGEFCGKSGCLHFSGARTRLIDAHLEVPFQGKANLFEWFP